MNNDDRVAQRRASRSFAQEMQQAFAEWVRKLPFMKKTDPDEPDHESPGGAAHGRATATRPAGGGRDRETH